jgi:hypothetical protein
MGLYGYLLSQTNITLYESGVGLTNSAITESLYARIKGDWYPEDTISFHLETTYSTDAEQGFVVDHAWASIALGPADLQFGKLPIGWGTGYVFNPTVRTYRANLLGSISDETPGTVAIAPSLSPCDWFALQGYLAFQVRGTDITTAGKALIVLDGEWDHLPYGLKLQTIAGPFDISAGFIKEVVLTPGTDDYASSHYFSIDFAGAVFDLGVYGEGVLSAGDPLFNFSAFDVWQDIEYCIGFDYVVPIIDVTLRGEYYHQGRGESEKSRYDVSRFLNGELLAEDYLFIHVERSFFSNLAISGFGFINLDDSSFIIGPAATYNVMANFQISTGGYLFVGDAGTEFNGEFSLPPSRTLVDFTDPQVFVTCKAYF